jgi:predicted nucleic-acid-binding Zn-ribbon protein
MRSGKCPKCGSTSIVTDARPVETTDGSAALAVARDANPDAFVFKDRRTTDLSACVCRDCGYVELYAVLPSVL